MGGGGGGGVGLLDNSAVAGVRAPCAMHVLFVSHAAVTCAWFWSPLAVSRWLVKASLKVDAKIIDRAGTCRQVNKVRS